MVWQLTVSAPHWSGWRFPLTVELPLGSLPTSPDQPVLLQPQHAQARPVVAQVEPLPHAERLWWLARPLTPGTQEIFTIQERAQPGGVSPMTVQATANQWLVTYRGRKLLEWAAPKTGIPRLLFYYRGRRLVTCTFQPQRLPTDLQVRHYPAWHTKRTESERVSFEGFSRQQHRPLAYRAGPVFASLRTSYRYTLPHWPTWTEEWEVRIFRGFARLLLVDIKIYWRADIQPLSIRQAISECDASLPTGLPAPSNTATTSLIDHDAGSDSQASLELLPLLRVGLAEELQTPWSVAPGWLLPALPVTADAAAPIAGPYAACLQPEVALAVMTHSATPGFPPQWQRFGRPETQAAAAVPVEQTGENRSHPWRPLLTRAETAGFRLDSLLECFPSLRPSQTSQTGPHLPVAAWRLPLGHTWSCHYRLLLGHFPEPSAAWLARRYLEFDCPPLVTLSNN